MSDPKPKSNGQIAAAQDGAPVSPVTPQSGFGADAVPALDGMETPDIAEVSAAYSFESAIPAVFPRRDKVPVYGALDLGTNNCRLIIVRPNKRGDFSVLDTFSRIIRLGEGISQTGMISEAAMKRAMEALKICAAKLANNNVTRARLIATEACRAAVNAPEFLDRAEREAGIKLEIISREMEARLAVAGCATLIDRSNDWALVFDIGGGSSELIWLDLRRLGSGGMTTAADRLRSLDCIVEWTSLPVGVVTLAERFGGRDVTRDSFERMVDAVMQDLAAFERKTSITARIARPMYMIGTSGTVTTLAGVMLDLPYYNRKKVDGIWMSAGQVRSVTDSLIAMEYHGRVAQPCIGRERADLVLGGCAILEAMMRSWPCERLRVADRGLREGILTTLMAEDGVRPANGWGGMPLAARYHP